MARKSPFDDDTSAPIEEASSSESKAAPEGAPRRRAKQRRTTQDSTHHASTAPERERVSRDDGHLAPQYEVTSIAELPPRRESSHSLGVGATRHDAPFPASAIDSDAQKVVRRLTRAGYEAYLVGGCVRDLYLGRKPKDFDIATSARPEQVRELFRNSRVIGRRFRLVHVLFHGGKVIEVATFRRNPRPDVDDVEESDNSTIETDPSLLIRADNAFGEPHEDAARRDFTINALFYDVDAGQILDWVGGMADLERRVVNTIGRPEVRFQEDPIRILRALKFAGRLDLGIHPEVYDAIVGYREALRLAAKPRVAEEILRLLRGGRARRTMFLAWETGVLDVLLPELSSLLYDDVDEADSGPRARVFKLLSFIDRRFEDVGAVDDTLLWTILLLEPLKEAVEGAKDRGTATQAFVEPILARLSIPRRFADGMRRVLGVLSRIESGRGGRFAKTDIFDLALDVAEADLLAQGRPTRVIDDLRAAPRERPERTPPGEGSRVSRRTSRPTLRR